MSRNEDQFFVYASISPFDRHLSPPPYPGDSQFQLRISKTEWEQFVECLKSVPYIQKHYVLSLFIFALALFLLGLLVLKYILFIALIPSAMMVQHLCNYNSRRQRAINDYNKLFSYHGE
jgi:hypothetical protein